MKWRAGQRILIKDVNWKENHNNAKVALRVQRSNLANDQKFLNDLAKAVNKLDRQAFNNALGEIYKLLGGDAAKRRDSFSTNCFQCAHRK
jgi:hypothetical protein